MKLVTKNKGARSGSRPVTIEFLPNAAGQTGHTQLIFESENCLYGISFESLEEVRALMSQASIIHHNYGGSND